MKSTYRLLLLAFPCAFSISGCSKDESRPAYIHIDAFTLNQNPAGFALNSESGNEGSLSNKITDAWVYVDDNPVGCYELPVTFPVLYSGRHHIKVRAGIKVNGIAATRAPYPFFKTYEEDVDLIAGERLSLHPSTMYESYTRFSFMENFENTGIIIDSASTSQAAVHYINTPSAEVFEGGNSGIAVVKGGSVYFECNSQQAYNLPGAGSPVFLEMNYKSDRNFVIGTIAQAPYYSKNFLINVHASDTWNKSYFYLTPNISASPGTSFKVYIYMDVTAGDSAAISFDNFKIVY